MEETPIYRLVKSANGKWGLKYDYNFMPKHITRDNKNSYNTRSGGEQNSIRVPSLKRSDRVWRNFYNLFPFLKDRTSYRGSKLKKLR